MKERKKENNKTKSQMDTGRVLAEVDEQQLN